MSWKDLYRVFDKCQGQWVERLCGSVLSWPLKSEFLDKGLRSLCNVKSNSSSHVKVDTNASRLI